MQAKIIFDLSAQHILQNQIHKIQLLHRKHDAVDLAAQLHQHANDDQAKADQDPAMWVIIEDDEDWDD